MDTIKPQIIPSIFTIADGTWGDKKFKLKNRFNRLNDDDLFFRKGGEVELSLRLQAKLNKSAAEVNMLIASL